MKDVLHYSFVLLLIAGIAGGGLWGVNALTEGRIAAAQEAALIEGQKVAFPTAASFGAQTAIDTDVMTVTYYPVYNEAEELIGYAVLHTVQGYQSPVTVLTGVSHEGIIQGIVVIDQAETPGLGAEVATIPTTRTLWHALGSMIGVAPPYEQEEDLRPPFQAQFSGKKPADIVVVTHETATQIQAISGATITSEAVARAVREPVEALLSYLTCSDQKEAGNAE